ncbi:MAG: hypothetical protein DESF_02576 [Desulfovibrio sp.]
MWTNLKSGNPASMRHAEASLNGFRYIHNDEGIFTPKSSIGQHQRFIAALEQWVDTRPSGPKAIITHHAPVINPKSKYLLSPLESAFVSYEMSRYLEAYELDLWIYGHTHEYDVQFIGKTQIISSQLGYPCHFGGYENTGAFDNYGCLLKFSITPASLFAQLRRMCKLSPICP